MHSTSYTTGPFYVYDALLAGIFIPPLSLFSGWLIGKYGFRSRQLLHIIIPALLFFLFHSIFPNKQERFILTITPLLVILGAVCYRSYRENTQLTPFKQRLVNNFFVFFFIVNTVLLVPVTLSYNKRARVESAYSLYRKKDVGALVIESTARNTPRIPFFYAGRQFPVYYISSKTLPDSAATYFDSSRGTLPDYIFFYGEKNIDFRLSFIENLSGGILIPVEKIEPAFLDKLLYRANPRYNVNPPIFIYKIEYPQSSKSDINEAE